MGPPADSPLPAAFGRLQVEIDHYCDDQKFVPKNLAQLQYNLLGKESRLEWHPVHLSFRKAEEGS